MRSLQNSFLRGWRLWVLLYLTLLFSSVLFERYSKTQDFNVVVEKSRIQDSETAIVFPDLEQESKEFSSIVSELAKANTILKIDYLSLAKQINNPSAQLYAEQIQALIGTYESDSLHIIASGFGTVVASHFLNSSESKVRSLTLFEPEGVLEFDLLGGYHLNRGVYQINNALSWTVQNLLPDFGFFENTWLNNLYSRTRLNTDLRNLSSVYNQIQTPTIIINPKQNVESLNSISSELNRLIVTSNLLSPVSGRNSSSELIQSFINNPRIDDRDISVSRKIKALLPFSYSKIISAEGWVLTGLMLLIIFSTFISEDLACIGAGLMVSRGLMSFFPAVAACYIGIFVGDILVYLSGRWLGKNAIRRFPLKWFINEKDIQRSNQWFQAKGPVIILISRFIPGTRFPTYFSAGVIGASFWMFIFYFGIASLLWTPAIVSLAMVLGNELIYYFSVYQEYALWVLMGTILFVLFVLKIIIPLFTFKGRRLLYGKINRLIRWEFWSIYVLYTPIVLYSLVLWIRFKKMTVVTAANPGIEEGGFKGESKRDILQKIGSTESVARFLFLDSQCNSIKLIGDALQFMETYSLSFPIVLKPDKGERGKGVQILKDFDGMKYSLSNLSEDHILQEFIEGKEFGVFYFRYPSDKNGNVFSITTKHKLSVSGDGKHTLEQLILKDDRAVCMAETHFDKHIDDLYSIPDEGEKILLTELGTHSRGSLFLDGSELITEDLVQKIDEISKSFKGGFYFGRYDLITDSEEKLTNGKGIKVIELNGVTSESTNIYDPKHSFIFAVRTLMKQWRIAFEIGAQNNKKGVTIPSFKHMLSLIFTS
ncbi:MAG: VTT domain-containing protein [Balneola sp.]|nr:VTT domain-containing protein [Balneola sp.]MBO6650728.1 VTT domain-containing protein [Balneola sp.]MBO6710640.1 VTT domain-containing protein [Balneola sp.]MBO6799326.1 VTT domain-containing protein [Balneola sp.]MBO6869545.1 VTT domain-containing protein [Balneola sp.]